MFQSKVVDFFTKSTFHKNKTVETRGKSAITYANKAKFCSSMI